MEKRTLAKRESFLTIKKRKKIGHYAFAKYPIDEMLDTETGIVYICSPGYDGCADHITPMLFDNGKPRHLNAVEIEKIKSMIIAIGEVRYQEICEDRYYCENFERLKEWSLKDLHRMVMKT